MNQRQLRARNQLAMIRSEMYHNRLTFRDHEVRLAKMEAVTWNVLEMQLTINMAYRYVLGQACIHPLTEEEQWELGRRLASQFKAIPELKHLHAA